MKKLFKKMRAGRPFVAPALWVLAFAAAFVGLGALFGLIWRALMAHWGVTAENYTRTIAPVKLLYVHGSDLRALLQGFALWAGLRLLYGTGRLTPARRAGLCIGVGVAAASLIWLILRLLDVVRVAHDAAAGNVWALLVGFCGRALLVGCGVRWAAWPAARLKGRGKPLCAAGLVLSALAGAAALCFIEGQADVWVAACGALMALLCAWAPEGAAYASGLAAAERHIFGMNGGYSALIPTYMINSAWLCGGGVGLFHGMAGAAALLAALGYAVWRKKSRDRQHRYT